MTATLIETEPVLSDFADDADFRELLEDFVNELPVRFQALVTAHIANDVEQVRFGAHQLKGAGGGYGFTGISDLAMELENACKAGDVDQVGTALDQLLGYLKRVRV